LNNRKKFESFGSFVREDAAMSEAFKQNKKGREFGKIVFFDKNFGEFQRKQSATSRGICVSPSV